MVQTNISLENLTNILEQSLEGVIKKSLKEKLMAQADSIVDEIATEIAKDITARLDSFTTISGQYGPEIRLQLHVGEKPKKEFKVERIVKEV